MDERLGVGVIGRGFARRHISAFQSLPDMFEVSAICSRHEAKVTEVAKQCQIPRVLTDIAGLCRVDDLDVIDLCTPSYLHFSQTKQVLAAGKHVICEKPMYYSVQTGQMVTLPIGQDDPRYAGWRAE